MEVAPIVCSSRGLLFNLMDMNTKEAQITYDFLIEQQNRNFDAAVKKINDKMRKKMFYTLIDPEALKKHEDRRKSKQDNRKWAWIILGKTRKMAAVDNKTMRAYKIDGHNLTWIEIKSFVFDRWCTGFDL